jgi:hypothetical protein
MTVKLLLLMVACTLLVWLSGAATMTLLQPTPSRCVEPLIYQWEEKTPKPAQFPQVI